MMKKIFLIYLFFIKILFSCTIENSLVDPFLYGESMEIKILGFMNDKVNLNGEWLKKGEMIQEKKIVKITKDCVFLQGAFMHKICVKKAKFLE